MRNRDMSGAVFVVAVLLALFAVGVAQGSIDYRRGVAAVESYPYYTTTLVEATPTTLFVQSVPVGEFVSGLVDVRVQCTDGAEFASAGWLVPYTCINKAGTENCNVGTVASNTAASGGATIAPLSVALNYAATNGWSLQVNATCSLVQTSLVARWRMEVLGSYAVTPQ